MRSFSLYVIYIPTGGEAESEDEEEEGVAELKKLNSDEVRTIRYGKEGVFDWLMS